MRPVAYPQLLMSAAVQQSSDATFFILGWDWMFCVRHLSGDCLADTIGSQPWLVSCMNPLHFIEAHQHQLAGTLLLPALFSSLTPPRLFLSFLNEALPVFTQHSTSRLCHYISISSPLPSNRSPLSTNHYVCLPFKQQFYI